MFPVAALPSAPGLRSKASFATPGGIIAMSCATPASTRSFPRPSATEQIDRHAAVFAMIRYDERLDRHRVVGIVAKDDDAIVGKMARREMTQQAAEGCRVFAHHAIRRIEKNDRGLVLRRFSGGEPSEQIAGDDLAALSHAQRIDILVQQTNRRAVGLEECGVGCAA